MTVYLVGAGPGDAGLLTVRGAELLSRADVVVHDRLSQPALLRLAPPNAQVLDVGKSPGAPVAQQSINAVLVELGRSGRTVVRLKGGDPFVFGRGGEEALALREAGVAYEVVPGVSAAVAAPAYAGVPLTHRGLSASFTVVTGHSSRSGRAVDWGAVAKGADTIVILMGVSHRKMIAEELIRGGRSPETPVVVASWATRSRQVVHRCSLAELGIAPAEPPATIVVGEVAGLGLEWLTGGPLLGQRVVVTRPLAQARELSIPLESLGAEVVELPTVELASPSDGGRALQRAARNLGDFEWVVLTSANGVERLWEHLRDARAFGGAHVAAIGPGTASALAKRGVVADLVPESYVAEGLLAAFPPPSGSRRVLLPRAAGARDVLQVGLEEMGWVPEVVEAYRSVVPQADEAVVTVAREADWVTFTAGSTVAGFSELVGSFSGRVAAIGPVTADAVRALGMRVDVEAAEHTIPGLVSALVSVASAPDASTPRVSADRRLGR